MQTNSVNLTYPQGFQTDPKTYIYDKVEKYVIVLEQQRSNGFYLLTAYHLNKEYGLKALEKKMKKRLQTPL